MISFVERITYFFTPDIYLAENVADLCDNGPRMRPKFQTTLFHNRRIYVLVHEVGVQLATGLMETPGPMDSEFCVVSDGSGEMVALWPNDENPVFSSMTKGEDIPGITEGRRVMVHQALFMYLIDCHLKVIGEVTHRAKPRRLVPVGNRTSYLERILTGITPPSPT